MSEILIKAVLEDNTPVFLFELSREPDINYVGSMGKTALIWAAALGRRDIVEILLNIGADTTIKDKLGFDAKTVAKRYPEILRLFEKHEKLVEKNAKDIHDNERILKMTAKEITAPENLDLLNSIGNEKRLVQIFAAVNFERQNALLVILGKEIMKNPDTAMQIQAIMKETYKKEKNIPENSHGMNLIRLFNQFSKEIH